MRTRIMSRLPKCDGCGNTATYDARVIHGRWGYFCEGCYKSNCYSEGATKLSLPQKEKTKSEKVIPAKCVADDFFDSVIDYMCPDCGHVFGLEPDACGVMKCENCGQKLSIEPMI